MSVNSLPPFPTPSQAVPTSLVRGTPRGFSPRVVWVLLGLWMLVAVGVMVYFVHRTIEAIEISQRPTPPPIEVLLLPDASEVAEIRVIPTQKRVFYRRGDASEVEQITVMASIPFEDQAVLAVKAWASPRTTVADCSLVLWMIDPPNIPERPTFQIPASEFFSFLALFEPARKNTWHPSYWCPWGYDLEITTNSGEYIKITLYPYRGRSDGMSVVAYIKAGKEWTCCYVADGDRLNEMIVKAMWARK